MPCRPASEFFEVDLPDAPPWATEGTSSGSGSMTEPGCGGDIRKWIRPLGALEWEVASFYDGQSAHVEIEQADTAADVTHPAERLAPVLSIEFPDSTPCFGSPADARRFAALILAGADELERIQGVTR